MLVRIVVALVLVAGIAACGLMGTLATWRMVDQVNAQLPQDKRFSHVGWWLGKTLSLYEEYDRRFPNSPRRRQLRLLMITAVILIAGLFADLFVSPR